MQQQLPANPAQEVITLMIPLHFSAILVVLANTMSYKDKLPNQVAKMIAMLAPILRLIKVHV